MNRILTPLFCFVLLLMSACEDTPVHEPQARSGGGFFAQQCEAHTLDVELIPGDPTTYELVGELCWRGSKTDKPVQVLVHGATYDRSYWDFPFKPWRHSYTRFATRKGYVTFAYDRLGSGESDKPLGVLVNLDHSAYVNSQVVAALRAGDLGPSYDTVVQVGHSFGSLISVTAAATYHDVDAVVLTGFAHQATEQANAGTQASVYPALLDPKFAGVITDDTYFTTIPGTRPGLFFSDLVESEVLDLDEQLKDLLTLGLVLDIPRHFSTESQAIDVPVFMITGDQDFIYCGEQVDCADPATYQAYEEGFYTAPVTTEIVGAAGHSLNLHKNARKTYRSIDDWLDDIL